MLEALGVNISADPAVVEKCVETVGIGFMFAPHFNPAMKYVGPVRKQLGIRTVFNILGPLSNPSRARAMLVGVYSPALTEVIAGTMMNLGVERGMVVSGEDNMDEITLTGETTVSEIKDGKVTTYTITPEQFGLKRCEIAKLQWGWSCKRTDHQRYSFRKGTGTKEGDCAFECRSRFVYWEKGRQYCRWHCTCSKDDRFGSSSQNP